MNTKLLYQQPVATVLLIQMEGLMAISGGSGMDTTSGGDATWGSQEE